MVRRLPMICTCSPDGLARADDMRHEAMRRLSEGSEELVARPVTPDNFLSVVVWSLQWDHQAAITNIVNDQWCGVRAESWKEQGGLNVYVECDRVEDGIAAVWLAFADEDT